MTPVPPGQTARASARWASVGFAALLGLASLGVGGALGSWQWHRSQDQAQAVEPDARAPLAEVMRPAEPGSGEGRLIEVSGTWADLPVALVAGREVDGAAATLMIRALIVAPDQTGTGQEATLPVLVGWVAEGEAAAIPSSPGEAVVTGYVRGGEGSGTAGTAEPPEGAIYVSGLSTAELAQQWPSPVYSYLVVADDPPSGWQAMPAPRVERSLDVRSLTYAIEWWLFGVFGAVLAGRWIRDNVTGSRAKEET